jgi:hypothetical protein
MHNIYINNKEAKYNAQFLETWPKIFISGRNIAIYAYDGAQQRYNGLVAVPHAKQSHYGVRTI